MIIPPHRSTFFVPTLLAFFPWSFLDLRPSTKRTERAEARGHGRASARSFLVCMRVPIYVLTHSKYG